MLEVAIGREIRAFRKKLDITVAELAKATNISLGMLAFCGQIATIVLDLSALAHDFVQISRYPGLIPDNDR